MNDDLVGDIYDLEPEAVIAEAAATAAAEVAQLRGAQQDADFPCV